MNQQGDGRVTWPVTALVIAVGFSVASCQEPVTLSPGDNLQAASNNNPPYTEFLLTAGVYRLQEVSPREGQKFIGELGPQGERLAVLNGSRVLSGWAQSGAFWWVGGQTQQQWQHGECIDPACRYAEELFIDNERRVQVLTLGELGPGRWYFDYAADRIYIAEEPTGHSIETSVANRAFIGPSDDVEVRNLIIEKYANQAQHGAVDSRQHNSAPPYTGVNWVVENNEVRWNHGAGIRLTDGGLARDNHVHHNGQMGVAAIGSGISFVENEISYNNFAGFEPGWEAGGSKFALTTDLEARGNYVHHNDGPGLWADIDCLRTRFEQNRVEFNGRVGIFYEISYEATIVNNLVIGNGFDFSVWGWGGGIVVAASPDVAVLNNILIGNADGILGIQQDRGTGAYGPRIVEDLLVSGNCIQQDQGWTGIVQDIGDNAPFCCRNNRFEENTYDLGNPDARLFAWNDGERLISEWRNFHPDDGATGSCDPNPLPGPGAVFADGFETGSLTAWSGIGSAD